MTDEKRAAPDSHVSPDYPPPEPSATAAGPQAPPLTVDQAAAIDRAIPLGGAAEQLLRDARERRRQSPAEPPEP